MGLAWQEGIFSSSGWDLGVECIKYVLLDERATGESLPTILLGLMLNCLWLRILLVWSALTSVPGVTRKLSLNRYLEAAS